jgi:hypothetical protein
MLWIANQCTALCLWSLDFISCMYEFILLTHKVCVVAEKSDLVSMHCAAVVVFSSVYIGVCLPKVKWKSWNERYVLLSNYYCNDMLWREDQCSALCLWSLDSISCMYEFILLMYKVCVVAEKSELVSMHCAVVVVFSSVYIGVCLGCCFIYFGLSICHCWWCAYCNLSIWWYLWGAFDNMQPWLSLFCDLLLHIAGGAFPYFKPGNISMSLLFCVFFATCQWQ